MLLSLPAFLTLWVRCHAPPKSLSRYNGKCIHEIQKQLPMSLYDIWWTTLKKKGQKRRKWLSTVHFCLCKISHFLRFFPLDSKNLSVRLRHMDTYCINAFFRTVLIRQTDVQQQLNLLNFTVTAIKSTVPPDHFSGSKVERVVQL